MPKDKSPILVSGAHRTGTTWVGKMLAASGEAAYISEPLNVLHRPGVLRAPTPYWYTYIHAQNQPLYEAALQETIRFQYHPWLEFKSLRSIKDLLRMARDWNIFRKGKRRNQRPLLKDPFAVFSAPWFNQQLGCRIIITVRHPAAFASSLKRLNWSFDFNDLLAQSTLMQDWLEPFRQEMQTISKNPDDIIGQASLLWRIIYQTVEQYRQQIPDLLIVRHEDLSLDAIGGFMWLYDRLGLHFTQEARDAVLNASSAENPKELSKKKIHTVHLNSRANIHNWKRRLEKPEITRIRKLTAETAEIYYLGETWE